MAIGHNRGHNGEPGLRRAFSRVAGTLLLAGMAAAGTGAGTMASGVLAQEDGRVFSAQSGIAAKPGWRIAQNISQNSSQSPEGEDEAQQSGEATQSEETSGEPAGGDSQPPLPQIITDLEEIPFPTRKMRQLILEAARDGDVEKLRPYLGYGDDVTMLSLGGHEEDPIEFLKSLSGDPDGHEILAIMTEILEAPPVRTEEISGEAIYVWPYFYAYPFDKLTPQQRVDMYRIITHGDYEEMVQFGSYIFYRLGITPEGRWRFFVAGD